MVVVVVVQRRNRVVAANGLRDSATHEKPGVLCEDIYLLLFCWW